MTDQGIGDATLEYVGARRVKQTRRLIEVRSKLPKNALRSKPGNPNSREAEWIGLKAEH